MDAVQEKGISEVDQLRGFFLSFFFCFIFLFFYFFVICKAEGVVAWLCPWLCPFRLFAVQALCWYVHFSQEAFVV